jgi:hypothetical protein
MIFIDERKLRTLMVATSITREVLLQRIQQVVASHGDKQPLCSLWYDNGGLKCTYCGEGAFDGTGPHACNEVNQEEEHERIEFYELLKEEIKERLPEKIDAPKRVNLKLYMELEGQVTEPDGLADMIAENSLKKCWYKARWGCCDPCARVYFGGGEEGKRDSICLTRSKEELKQLKEELEEWLTG